MFGLLLLWPLVLGAAGCDCDAGLGPPVEMDFGVDVPGCVGTNGAGIDCDLATNVCCVDSSGAPQCVRADPYCDTTLLLCATLEPPSAANGCTYRAALNPGQLATHLDMAIGPDGGVLLSGHAPGRPANRYGDLVVGTVQDGVVSWRPIDGVPEGGPVPNSDGIVPTADGWRGGIVGAGDNVGEFNAIAVHGDTIGISYYDRTGGDLKYASSSDGGTTWTAHTVYSEADSGRYSSLAFLADGRPAISFLTLLRGGATAEPPRSAVRVVIATSATPASAGDWALHDGIVPETPMPCGPGLCAEGQACRSDTRTCAALSTDPDADCSFTTSDGDVRPGCKVDLPAKQCLAEVSGNGFECVVGFVVEDLPIANGLHTVLRATASGLALVWHDRTRRTLLGSAFDTASGTWRAPFAIDGFDAVGEGDAGYSADLFIDPTTGDWHLAYVDGAFEELRHGHVLQGTLGDAVPTITRSIIDDGGRPPGLRSLVGTDAELVVLASGEIRVVYQDSTRLEALLAVRPPGEVSWVLQGEPFGPPLDGTDSTGFWTTQALIQDTSHIATWWFNREGSSGANGTRLFTVGAP